MPPIHDPTLIRAILTANRPWSAYALADLEPGFSEHSQWWVAAGGAPALVLLYGGFGTPVLFALGAAAPVRELLAEVESVPEVYLHIRPEILPLIEARSPACRAWAMWRMLLDPSSFHPSPPASAVRIGPADLTALQRLYADGAANDEA